MIRMISGFPQYDMKNENKIEIIKRVKEKQGCFVDRPGAFGVETEEIIEILDNLPKGRWIKNKYNDAVLECSECGRSALKIVVGCHNKHYEYYKSNFCPHCGKEMEI